MAKIKRYKCPYCDRIGAGTFKHIKDCHPNEYQEIIDNIVSAFHHRDCNCHTYTEFGIPEFVKFRTVCDIWKEHYSEQELNNKYSYDRNYTMNITFAKRKNLSDEQAEQYAKEQIQSQRKITNNNICPRCNEYVIENSWLDHNKTYHYDYYQKQLRLAIQCFDNLDLVSLNDYQNMGLECSIKNIKDLWCEVFSSEDIDKRAKKFAGRKRRKNEGKQVEDLNWNTTNDENSTLQELINHHTEFLKKSKLKQFVKLGILIPRIDLPNYEGFRSGWEANLARIFIYHNKSFTYEQCFKMPDDFHRTKRGYVEYHPDFCDYDNLFGFGKNTYLEVKGVYDDHADECRLLFKKYNPDKKLIFVGIPNNDFQPEINYEELEKQYNHLPYWETKKDNAYVNPEKFLSKEFKHYIDTFEEQKQLVISLYKQGITQNHYKEYGCTLHGKIIGIILDNEFTSEERKYYSSILKKNAKLEKQKSGVIYTTKTYYEKVQNWSVDYSIYQEYAKSLPYTFENFEQVPIHEQLDYCPICNEYVKKSGDSLSKHLYLKGVQNNPDSKEHAELFDKEMKHIIRGFFDLDLDLNHFSMFSSDKVLDIWKNVFSNYRQRIEMTFMKGRSKTFKQKLIYSSINWNLDYIKRFPEVKLPTNICPICKKNSELGLWNHLAINDKQHQDLLYGFIHYLYNQFYNFDFNRKNLSGCYLDYRSVTQCIWKKFNLDVSTRINKERDLLGRGHFQNRGCSIASGYRKDLDYTCHNSWEANVYRVYEHLKLDYTRHKKVYVDINGEKTLLKISMIDLHGLFEKNAYLIVAGNVTNRLKEKINLFKQQFPNKSLLVIGDKRQYPCDFDYFEFEKQYRFDTEYWETVDNNPLNNSSLFKKK